MLLPHALVLADARLRLAALADQATTVDVASAYERVLIELDRIHSDACPAVSTDRHAEGLATFPARLTSALEELDQYGVESLRLELLLVMFEDARALDGT
ncbi:hypothetical protein [Nocardioides campestrisoli]|uniref:hypothetical protein n=1 Tax=Nocardioides campestrisoli TaxID=2736757 RepID=UPI00163D611D|nr:hypothetical protein [Nocardioides campestrisoli]